MDNKELIKKDELKMMNLFYSQNKQMYQNLMILDEIAKKVENKSILDAIKDMKPLDDFKTLALDMDNNPFSTISGLKRDTRDIFYKAKIFLIDKLKKDGATEFFSNHSEYIKDAVKQAFENREPLQLKNRAEGREVFAKIGSKGGYRLKAMNMNKFIDAHPLYNPYLLKYYLNAEKIYAFGLTQGLTHQPFKLKGIQRLDIPTMGNKFDKIRHLFSDNYEKIPKMTVDEIVKEGEKLLSGVKTPKDLKIALSKKQEMEKQKMEGLSGQSAPFTIGM